MGSNRFKDEFLEERLPGPFYKEICKIAGTKEFPSLYFAACRAVYGHLRVPHVDTLHTLVETRYQLQVLMKSHSPKARALVQEFAERITQRG